MPKPKRVPKLKTRTNKSAKLIRSQSKRSGVTSGRFWDQDHPALAKALICLGLALLSYFALHHYFYWRSLELSRAQIATGPIQEDHSKEPTHIFIKWFVDAPIEPMALVGSSWAISPDKVSFLTQSKRPGEAGNIILYGHNTRQILGNIRALKGHETIILTTGDGKEHSYTVSQMKEVDPSDVSWLQPTDTETLTMYTCSGLLDSKRFLVRAIPLQ
ncbi:MAG: sortase [Candidatus Woesebacteria bacterium]